MSVYMLGLFHVSYDTMINDSFVTNFETHTANLSESGSNVFFCYTSYMKVLLGSQNTKIQRS